MVKNINTFKKYFSVRPLLFLVFSLCIIISLTNSSLWYRAGSLFFGKVPMLYNVAFANFSYINAAYPLIGKAVPYSHYQLSRTYFIQGDFTTALLEAQKELIIYPENTRTYYILGLTYGYMNEEEKAIEAFSEFIKTHKDTWAGRNDKAWLQFRVGDINGALSTLEPIATTTGLHNPWVQNTYGTILMNKGSYKEAKEALLRAQKSIQTFTPELWGAAYPGNDPRIYDTGLLSTKKSIDYNLTLVEKKISIKK